MNHIDRAIHEQVACQRYLADDAALRAYCDDWGCTLEQARAGALAGIADWVAEEVILRTEVILE